MIYRDGRVYTVAQPEFEEIGMSYSVTENYFVTPNQIILKTSIVSRLGSCLITVIAHYNNCACCSQEDV